MIGLTHPSVVAMVIPAAVALACGALARALAGAGRTALTGAALGTGFLIAYLLHWGLPDLPPGSMLQRLGLMAAAALLVGLVLDLAGSRRGPGAVVLWCVPVAGMLWLAWPSLASGAPWTVALGLGAVIYAAVVMGRASRVQLAGHHAAVVVVVSACALGLVASLAGSGLSRALALALAGAAIGALPWSWIGARERHAAGTVLAGYGLLVLLWGQGLLEGDAYLPALLLVGSTPAVEPLLGRTGLWRRCGALSPVVLTLACLVPAGAGLALAMLASGRWPY